MAPAFLTSSQFIAGLAILLEAIDAAEDCGVNHRDFAVDLPAFDVAGFSRIHLRWLICKGYLEHGRDLTPQGKNRRSFQHLRRLRFLDSSCFMLTPAGVEFAHQVCATKNDGQLLKPNLDATVESNQTLPVPVWDSLRRRLTIGDEVVIRFVGRRGNQELVLAAFQEEGWPATMDDPLPRLSGPYGNQRLRGAVEKLNARVLIPRIHFLCDGTGEGVGWRHV